MIIFYILITLLALYGGWKIANKWLSTDKLNKIEQNIEGDIERAKKLKTLVEKKRQLRVLRKEVINEKDKDKLEEEKLQLEKQIETLKGEK